MQELVVSQIWHAQWVRREALRTTDGRVVRVVYRGRWSHGLGPDFQDAMLVFDDGPLLRGDIEVHRQAGDWVAHGHAADERYRSVILHVTYEPASADCRRLDGAAIPQLVLRDVLPDALERFAPPAVAPISALGHGPCANHETPLRRERVLAVMHEAGRQRLADKVARASANLTVVSPAQALYADLLEALGYTRNRQPFRDLAATVSLADLDALVVGATPAQARVRLAGVLLGVAGFLPWAQPGSLQLTSAFAEALLHAWQLHGQAWRPAGVAPRWDLTRARPANHPARRILGLVCMLGDQPGRLLDRWLDLVRQCSGQPRTVIQSLGATLWPGAAADGAPPTLIGADRAADIAINVMVVHALIAADRLGDAALGDAAWRLAEALPARSDEQIARAMLEQLGGTPLPRLRSALDQLGLHQLYHRWCASRRCYECPIARAVSVSPAPSPTGDP